MFLSQFMTLKSKSNTLIWFLLFCWTLQLADRRIFPENIKPWMNSEMIKTIDDRMKKKQIIIKFYIYLYIYLFTSKWSCSSRNNKCLLTIKVVSRTKNASDMSVIIFLTTCWLKTDTLVLFAPSGLFENQIRLYFYFSPSLDSIIKCKYDQTWQLVSWEEGRGDVMRLTPTVENTLQPCLTIGCFSPFVENPQQTWLCCLPG